MGQRYMTAARLTSELTESSIGRRREVKQGDEAEHRGESLGYWAEQWGRMDKSAIAGQDSQ